MLWTATTAGTYNQKSLHSLGGAKQADDPRGHLANITRVIRYEAQSVECQHVTLSFAGKA
jgi:hypothetical protein